MEKPALIFDLDGTLIDSREDLTAAVNGMLTDAGAEPVSLEEVVKFIGDGSRKLAERALKSVGLLRNGDESNFDRYFENFMVHYGKNLSNKTTIYPGVVAFLKKHADLPMAVVTNKPSRWTEPVLEAYDLLKYFRFVAGGDAYRQKKPDPYPLQKAMESMGASPDHTFMIGDGDTDIKAGQAAGVTTVAVLFGYRSPELLQELHPDYTISHFSDLEDIIRL